MSYDGQVVAFTTELKVGHNILSHAVQCALYHTFIMCLSRFFCCKLEGMIYNQSFLVIVNQLCYNQVTDSTYGGGNSAGNSLPTIAGHVYVFQVMYFFLLEVGVHGSSKS